MIGRNTSQIVTLVLMAVTSFATTVRAEIYRVDLKEKSSVIRTQLIDTTKTDSGLTQVGGGIAVEIRDKVASCGVFIQGDSVKTANPAANVMVSLIKATGPIAKRAVVSNSALIAKHKIAESEQDVLPNSAGRRSVSVEAAKLHRSCTVSVL